MTVAVKPPPAALIRVLNPMMRVVLPTRLGRRMQPLAVLEITGHRTGRLHRIPVGLHEVDGEHVVFTDRPWRENARGGTEVVIASGGQRRRAMAELVDDPSTVGESLAVAVDQVGARRLGLQVPDGDAPTAADYAATGKSMIRIRFT